MKLRDFLNTWVFDILFMIVVLALLLCLAALGGCKTLPIASPPVPWYEPWKAPGTANVTGTLNFWFGFGVFGLAVAGALLYLFAAEHRLAIAIAIGSGILIGTSLLLQVVVPWLPLLGAVGTIVAFGLVAYKIYQKNHATPPTK